ncbi:MAG: MFS transporter [Alphaproteobacteria bacterium]|nr:MFS transporter [Alphaproteobacteria bacterium]MBU1514716.1 MFS transporter [Alphaproteobacteria bacterium]MBU2093847.1 MFS transporter [Alphaproteobacteria bacterium]MBU2150916.1 MFS transporter [Alphaproteobacteria bacterium]MBU2309702.1 MFS transporter [Alphaproteobacteria bacterium]
MPMALYALTVGAFGIGVTEFVIMGLLLQVSGDLGVSVPAAGMLITAYALGVFVGAPVLTLATRRLPRKSTLMMLMGIFTIGNLACALAPTYEALMGARLVTALAHGTFFGVGSVLAAQLVAPDKRASAIALMFSGLTLATLAGVPLGAWIGLAYGWRSTFAMVTVIGALALAALIFFVPKDRATADLAPLSEELAVLRRPQVLLALLTTVFGFGSVFAVISYIQPMLVELAGFSKAAVSPILLVFGGGLFIGNIAGGKLADRWPVAALLGTVAALAISLGLMTFAVHSQFWAVVFTGLLGVTAFATVAPLQIRVLEQAGGAGQGLASSLNIAAFNLGNALGAGLGGYVIEHGPGLEALPLTGAVITLAGLGVAAASLAVGRGAPTAASPPV